jgi:diguanylate cyclase (GGDEF)-like protein
VLVNATAVKDAQGDYLMSRTTVFDVTEVRRLQREVAEADQKHHAFLEEMAMRDFLTGLANRSMLYDRFKVAQSQAQRNNRLMALMELDLDDFKTVNDTMGHAAGDDLLKATAGRLQSVVRQGDTVARLGGDEFAVLLPEIRRIGDSVAVAKKILAAFSRPFAINGDELNISASIGIAIYPEKGETIDALLKTADEAMYYTKEHGRKGYTLAEDAGEKK